MDPFYVNWAITDRCNLHCIHCRGMESEELNTKEALNLVSDIVEVNPPYVTLDGGEPLMRSDVIDLLDGFSDDGMTTYLITNGTLLTSHIMDRITDLGVKLMISIDGATKTTYEMIRRGADFDLVLKNAQDCGDRGALKAISMVMTQLNFKELPGMIELAKDLGAEQIIFVGLKPPQNAKFDSLLLTPDQYRESFRAIASEKSIDVFVDEPFYIPFLEGLGIVSAGCDESGIVAGQAGGCIFGKYMFIEPNGGVKPCTFAPLSFGNAREKPLTDIWQSMENSEFLKKIWDPSTRKGKCGDCVHKECMGCRSRTFALTGDWFATDPACPLEVR